MKINKVIRKYRKEQNLTQEQIANYLGVTAPAVNKWENGISYPDITLLAPLARFLKTDTDTLLSFHDELTDMEINNIVREISTEITTHGYQASFEKVSNLIKEYPNCDKLILFTAQILNAYLTMQDMENHERYKKQIMAWFETVAFGTEIELADMATASLCQSYIANGDYEESQKLLDNIPPMGFDKRIMQANLYSSQEKYDEAYEIHEKILYQNVNGIISSLMQIIQLMCKQKEYDNAMIYAKASRVVAENFDLGQYIAGSSELMIALEMKNKDESLRLLEDMVTDINKMYCIKNSKLYQHMKFKEECGFSEIKNMINKSLEKDKQLDFIRQEPEFLRIMSKLSVEE
ncbi:helix-turn-helix domain-containing protein [Alkalibaculum sporogenes]|nr:helix-turn-helix transcriptional regulator [Alkalibaculum sporogenes]